MFELTYIREIQIKTFPRYHFSLVRLAKISKYGNRAYTALSCPSGGNANWSDSPGGKFGKYLTKLHMRFPFYPAVPLLAIHLEDILPTV